MSARDLLHIHMARPNICGLPQHHLPEGWSFRWYRSGDRAAWARIEGEADKLLSVSAETHRQEFGSDERLLAERQCFLCDTAGREVGTASAWFENWLGESWGRIHWVAIVPEHQGKGLAKPLLSLVCNRLVELGHQRLMLVTEPPRLAAINLYLQYGFIPKVVADAERPAWEKIREQLVKDFPIT